MRSLAFPPLADAKDPTFAVFSGAATITSIIVRWKREGDWAETENEEHEEVNALTDTKPLVVEDAILAVPAVCA